MKQIKHALNNPATPESDLIREGDASQSLGVSVSTLRRWRLLGKGPIYRKLNGAVRYTPSDLQQFVEKAARISTGEAA